MKEEPWIDPDGAKVEEIVATIRKCPSGALSYALDGAEARPPEREPMITVDRRRALRGRGRRRAAEGEVRGRRLAGALHAVPLRRFRRTSVLATARTGAWSSTTRAEE